MQGIWALAWHPRRDRRRDRRGSPAVYGVWTATEDARKKTAEWEAAIYDVTTATKTLASAPRVRWPPLEQDRRIHRGSSRLKPPCFAVRLIRLTCAWESLETPWRTVYALSLTPPERRIKSKAHKSIV